MESSMRIDGSRVRALRDAKAWSQEHLAAASDLSVRTVQRVEAEGAGSSETCLAIAAALGVAVSDITHREVGSARDPSAGYRRGVVWGWGGYAAGFGCALAAIGVGYASGATAEATARHLGVVCGLMGVFARVLAGAGGWARRSSSST
jgi:DNA-binding XRE family transcriptional regulator